jgi:uncharacterized protein with PhoU and TrkA domain
MIWVFSLITFGIVLSILLLIFTAAKNADEKIYAMLNNKMTNNTIDYFTGLIEATRSREDAESVVVKIILAAANDDALVNAAVNYTNEQFMLSYLEKHTSNQSELN